MQINLYFHIQNVKIIWESTVVIAVFNCITYQFEFCISWQYDFVL